MTSVLDFLRERLEDDEGRADLAGVKSGYIWSTTPVQSGLGIRGRHANAAIVQGHPRAYADDDHLWDDESALGMYEDTAEHVVRHDPHRVLNEVAAKRQVIAFVDEWFADGARDHYLLKVLASTYADHPDYCEEWRP